MADNSVISRSGLAGLFGIPGVDLRQQQEEKDAFARAALTPTQQLSARLIGGGKAAGRQIAGLLGAEDPVLKEQSVARTIRTELQQQGLNPNSPEFWDTLTVRLGQAGAANAQAEAANIGMQVKEKNQKIATDRATEQSKLRDQVKQVGLTTDGRQVYQSGANQFILTEQGPQPYYGALESKQSKTNINVNTAGETEASKIIGKGVGEKVLATAAAGEAAADNLTKINETLTELKTGDAFTGSFAELQTNLSKVQAKFAADKKAGKRVTDTEYLDAVLGSDVFPMISSLGIGAKGLDTPAEREFLRKVMTGTVGLERDTLIKLTETRKNIAERAIKKYNDQVESGELDEYFRIKKTTPKKIAIPKTDDSAALGRDYEEYAQYWVNKGKTPKTREQYIEDKRKLTGSAK